jgi:hypothetical protein
VNVDVVLLGQHRALLPPGTAGDTVTLTFAADAVSLGEVAGELRLPAGAARIALLRGESIPDEHLLRDGDVVTFVSPIGGG